MADAYTAFWSRDRCEAARSHAGPSFRFEVLFGGPHVSMPSLSRAGVRQGDWIYPIAVRAGALHVIGRMQVEQIVPIAVYGGLPAERAARGVTTPPGERLEDRALWGMFLSPSCISEVALGTAGSPLLLETTVPPEQVAAIRFCSRRGERPIKHVAPDGRITAISSLQGVYRLSAASAELFARVVESATSGIG